MSGAMNDAAQLIRDLPLIIQSQPAQLIRFAERYAKVAGAAEAQQALLDREIEKVQIHTVGRMGLEVGMYRGRTGEGLVKLGQAGQDVNNGLQQAAPHIAEIRKKLLQLRWNLPAGGAAVGLSAWASNSPWIGLIVGAVGGTIPLSNLLKEYRSEMDALSGAMALANEKMDVLDELNKESGGLVPQPPVLQPN